MGCWFGFGAQLTVVVRTIEIERQTSPNDCLRRNKQTRANRLLAWTSGFTEKHSNGRVRRSVFCVWETGHVLGRKRLLDRFRCCKPWPNHGHRNTRPGSVSHDVETFSAFRGFRFFPRASRQRTLINNRGNNHAFIRAYARCRTNSRGYATTAHGLNRFDGIYKPCRTPRDTQCGFQTYWTLFLTRRLPGE